MSGNGQTCVLVWGSVNAMDILQWRPGHCQLQGFTQQRDGLPSVSKSQTRVSVCDPVFDRFWLDKGEGCLVRSKTRDF